MESSRIISTKPDVVFFANVGGQVVLSMIKLKQLGYSGPKLAAWMEESYIGDSKGAAEGTIFPSVIDPKPEFEEKFKAKYGITAQRGASTSYDTLMIYASAVKNAGTFDPAAVIPILKKTRYDGASGRFEFNEIGDALRTPTLKVIKDGKIVRYQ